MRQLREADNHHACQTSESEILVGWWNLYVSALRKCGYKAVAEDVASEIITSMLSRKRQKGILQASPKWLHEKFKKEAIRLAARMSGQSLAADINWGTLPETGRDDDEPLDFDPLKPLELVFPKSQIEVMVDSSRIGPTCLKSLAHTLKLSERTFRSRVNEIRNRRT